MMIDTTLNTRDRQFDDAAKTRYARPRRKRAIHDGDRRRTLSRDAVR